jgi:hypothetical protein
LRDRSRRDNVAETSLNSGWIILMRALLVLGILSQISGLVAAAEPTAVAIFDEPTRPKKWMVNFGHWEPKDGVLVARQLDKDNHAAASRWQIPLADGTVKLRLKFAGATGFHVGFDPIPGSLDKQGHLYSLVVTPTQAQLRKHKDKAKADSKEESLATAKFDARDGKWADVELTTTGDKVQVTITAGSTTAKLEATDPSFHVGKPTVVFRVIGGDVQLDDVTVTVTKPAPAPKTAAKR